MRLRIISAIPGLCLAALALQCASRAQEAETVRLTAKPAAIFADGATTTTITAEVRDRSGGLVPNGLPIRFSTTLGSIESAASSQGGQASVRLTSSTVPGRATVTASAGHATAEITVEFSSRPIVFGQSAAAVSVRADYLLYNDFEGVVDATGSVRFKIGRLQISADRAQMLLERSTIVAESKPGASALTITFGDKHIAADRFQYNWEAHTGMVFGLDEPVRGLFEFSGFTGELTKALGPLPAHEFEFADLTPSPFAVRASRVLLLPGVELQFTHARLILNGKERLTLPYHVKPLDNTHLGYAQYIGLGPRGPLLDIPYYVAAGAIGSSQLRMKFNAPEGLYGATVPGWALDLLTKYDLGRGTDGSAALTRITSPDWGLSWTHNQNLGQSTRGYFNVDTRTGYGALARYTLANMSLSHQAKGYNTSFTAFGSRTQATTGYENVPPEAGQTLPPALKANQTTGNVDLSAQSTPRPLAAGFAWTVGGSVGRQWLATTMLDPTWKTLVYGPVQGVNSQSVSGRIIAPTVKARGGFAMDASFGQGLSFGSGSARRSTQGTVTARQPLGKMGSANFVYNYSDFGYRPTPDSDIIRPERQTITASLSYGKMPKWSMMAFATVGIDQKTRNFRVSGQYLFSPVWAATLNAGIFRQGLSSPNPIYETTFQAVNIEARVTRIVGERSLSLVYSTFQHKVYLDYVPGRYF
ncbi:MAG TPA: Ig-like domain-containing protein [Armatimonadota bacterium]|jgi:hypothetical protein